MNRQKRLIAEFEEQSYTQIIFPHKKTDWVKYLDAAQSTFVTIVNAIKKYQKCLIVSYDIEEVKKHFIDKTDLLFVEYETNDTWARDCSALCVQNHNKIELLDFTFDAWGSKFDAKKDNAMTQNIMPDTIQKDFVLEGGSVDSNGVDTILTTSACMLSRNAKLSKKQILNKLQNFFGAKKILFLEHGYLAGDDTDSHIDTLARFIDEKTIMYVKCIEKTDEHFKELHLMEQELKEIAKKENYKLIALPMSEAIYYQNERLPASYANFLFVNGAVLVPIYGVKEDSLALNIFRENFKNRDIIPIDCAILIRQHGSLHCVTMNFHHQI